MTAVAEVLEYEDVDDAGESLGPPPVVYEPLTDEEAYLYAIMTDPSGLDQAEFTWVNEEEPDGCWRAWPFQWAWWRCQDRRQVDQAGRAIGKSEGLMARACAFPFIHPGEEMVITAPEGIHADAITERIEGKLTATWVLREMLVGGRMGIGHRPFKVRFKNGARILGRIPQRTGVGVKGAHPIWLELDEGQDYPERGWAEVRETLKRELEGAIWRVHGVSRGIPDEFTKITQPGSGWTVHRFTQKHKPTWDEEEDAERITEYGSKEDPDYRRNVMGEHGDAQNAIFVLSRLMRGVDKDAASAYNVDEYYRQVVKFEQVEERARHMGLPPEQYGPQVLPRMIEFPGDHLSRYKTFWAGMDVGIAKDPSAIMIWAEYEPSAEERRRDQRNDISVPPVGMTRFKLITRLELLRIPVPDQAYALVSAVEFYKPRALSLDKTGNGLGVLQVLQREARISRLMKLDLDAGMPVDADVAQANEALTRIKGYEFHGRIIVAIDEVAAAELPPGHTIAELVDKAGIKAVAKEYATDKMRELSDTNRLLMPLDENLIRQLTGQTFVYNPSNTDAYGNPTRRFSEGQFHAFDGCRMALLGAVQEPIETFLRTPPPKKRPVRDRFLGGR